MSLLTYKGYTAEVEYDAQEGILYGHVLDLRDTITFQSESASEIVDEFRTSVDEYLSFCAEQGIEPAKPYSGTLYPYQPGCASRSRHRGGTEWEKPQCVAC